MSKLLLAFAFCLVTTGAYAGTCTEDATAKKLAGAAKTSFMTKCETDAKASCEKQAAEKKVYGAAKASFEKKCITDAVGAAP